MQKLNLLTVHHVVLAGFLVLCVGCRTPGNDKPIGEVVDIKAPLGLPPVPIPPDNPPTAETIALGRKLFYDTRLSKDNTVSCASCHNPNLAFTDGRRLRDGRRRNDWRPQCSHFVECGLLAAAILGWPCAQSRGAVGLSDCQPGGDESDARGFRLEDSARTRRIRPSLRRPSGPERLRWR